MLKGLGVLSPLPSRDAEPSIEPHVRGGAPSSDGVGEGAESTKAYPFMRGVAEPGAPASEAVGRGRPARASPTAERDGDGGGSEEGVGSARRRVLS